MLYSCHCCKFNSVYKKDYVKHLSTKKHLNNLKNNTYCDICKKDYENNRSYKIHHTKIHSKSSLNTDSTISNDIIINTKKNSNKKQTIKEHIIDVKEGINQINEEIIIPIKFKRNYMRSKKHRRHKSNTIYRKNKRHRSKTSKKYSF